MLKKSIIIINTLVVLVFAEIPVSGPYPPSGWRPQGAPFELPQQQQPRVDIEISKERVDFAGQFSETISNQPNNEYLPPKTNVPVETNNFDDFLKVQGLPLENKAKFTENNNAPLNLGEIILPRQINNFEKSQLQQNSQASQQSQFNNVNQEVLPIQNKASNEYGSPTSRNFFDNNNNDEFNYQLRDNVDEEKTGNDSNLDDNNSESNSQIVTNGQYYILGKDKKLQRVVFRTIQNADEANSNGFTAQLKYVPVEPIRDPIYAYNDQGQLVRIFKK